MIMAMSEMTKTGTDATLTSMTGSCGFLGDLMNATCPIPNTPTKEKNNS
jgi:hypothetical protein